MGEREREDEPPKKRTPMDMNIYTTRKTVAQGMMDIALLTANASQLKYILKHADVHDYFLINVILLGLSMSLQVIVGILLIVVGRWNINSRKEQHVANVTNNVIVILIFLITVINVLISAFGDDNIDVHWTDALPEDVATIAPSAKDLIKEDNPSHLRIDRSLKSFSNCSDVC